MFKISIPTYCLSSISGTSTGPKKGIPLIEYVPLFPNCSISETSIKQKKVPTYIFCNKNHSNNKNNIHNEERV